MCPWGRCFSFPFCLQHPESKGLSPEWPRCPLGTRFIYTAAQVCSPVPELGKIYYGRVINLGLPPRALLGLYLMGCFLSSGAVLLASLDQLCLIIKIFDAEN